MDSEDNILFRLWRIENSIAAVEKICLDIHNFLLKNSTEYQAHDNPKPHRFNWTTADPGLGNVCHFCGVKAEDIDIFIPCPGRA